MKTNSFVKRFFSIAACFLVLAVSGTSVYAEEEDVPIPSSPVGIEIKVEWIRGAGSYDELAWDSDLVVAATITGSEPVMRWKSNTIYTSYALNVKKVIKNKINADTANLSVESMGGTKDGVTQYVEHIPTFNKGQVYLLLLRYNDVSDSYGIVGPMAQGVYQLFRPDEYKNKILSNGAKKGLDYGEYRVVPWRNNSIERSIVGKTINEIAEMTVNAAKPLPEVSYPVIPAPPYDQEYFENNRTDEAFDQAFRSFGAKTASHLLSGELKKDSEKNYSYSPASVAYALGALGIGTGGESRKQVAQALGVSGLDTAAESYGKLYRRMYNNEDGRTIQIANSIWMQKGTKYHQSFVDQAAQHFYASPHVVDFAKEEAAQEMSQWVFDHTNGKLKPSFATDENTSLSVINTIYFKGRWSELFTKYDIIEKPFHLSDGSELTAPFLNRVMDYYSFYETDQYLQSDLYFEGGNFISFVLPKGTVTPLDIVSSPEALDKIVSPGEAEKAKVIFQIPKFRFQNEFNLKPTFRALGLGDLFDQAKADFSNITDQKIFLSEVEQGTYIQLDENGCEAAAYTAEVAPGAALQPDLPRACLKNKKYTKQMFLNPFS